MGQRFIWVLFAYLRNSSWMPFQPGPFKGCYSVTSTEGSFSIRQEAWSRRNIKALFPNGCSIIFLAESIEGWSKKQDKTSKQTVRSSDKSEWTIEAKWVTGKYIPRGERDVIRLRNPTEDKRAFRRMLTSADLLVFRYGGHIGKRQETRETRLARGKDALRCCPTFSSFPTVTKTLTFKTRVSAKSLWCKGVLFAWDEYQIFFKPIASHLATLWHWALGQLSNCQFSFYLYCYLFPFLFFTCISTCRLTQRL